MEISLNNINIDEPIREVVISGLAVLKIVKHCRQYIPTRVTGQLLGLGANGILEVTDSFVLPLRGPSGEDDKDPDPEYGEKMLRSLRDVNVDNISVGWYISTFLGQHLDLPVPDPRNPRNQDELPFLINTQFNWQSGLPNSVVILYDYLASSHGSLCLRALRLTNTFMEAYKNKDVSFKKEKLTETNFSFRNIFEEIPIRIDNQGLATALLYQLETDDSIFDQFESFDLGADDFMEKNLEIILSSLNDLQNKQNVHQAWQRTVTRSEQAQKLFIEKRMQENKIRQTKGLPLLSEQPEELTREPETAQLFKKIPEPWKVNLESLVLSYRVADQCHQVSHFAGQTLTKQFLAKTVYNSNKG